MKCTIFHISFLHVHRSSCRTRERAKCHMHAYHTRTNVFRSYARHTRINKPERSCDKMQRFGKTKTHITMSAHKI